MGWERKTITIAAQVSRHNSERDERDDALWDDMEQRITEIVNEPKYSPIYPILN